MHTGRSRDGDERVGSTLDVIHSTLHSKHGQAAGKRRVRVLGIYISSKYVSCLSSTNLGPMLMQAALLVLVGYYVGNLFHLRERGPCSPNWFLHVCAVFFLFFFPHYNGWCWYIYTRWGILQLELGIYLFPWHHLLGAPQNGIPWILGLVVSAALLLAGE